MSTLTAIVSAAPEVFFAAIIAALLAVLRVTIPPLRDWLEATEWDKLFVFGLAMVAGAVLWALACPGGVGIPGFSPRCSFEGVLMDALYPAFLAFAVYHVGENLFKFSKSRLLR